MRLKINAYKEFKTSILPKEGETRDKNELQVLFKNFRNSDKSKNLYDNYIL